MDPVYYLPLSASASSQHLDAGAALKQLNPVLGQCKQPMDIAMLAAVLVLAASSWQAAHFQKLPFQPATRFCNIWIHCSVASDVSVPRWF